MTDADSDLLLLLLKEVRRRGAHDEKLYSTADACRALSIRRTTLYKLLGSGRLRSRKLLGKRLIEGASLQALINGCAPGLGEDER
ncbi:MAG: helix-turn-helix domain-containing protein [Janthinobacterium lividum]